MAPTVTSGGGSGACRVVVSGVTQTHAQCTRVALGDRFELYWTVGGNGVIRMVARARTEGWVGVGLATDDLALMTGRCGQCACMQACRGVLCACAVW